MTPKDRPELLTLSSETEIWSHDPLAGPPCLLDTGPV